MRTRSAAGGSRGAGQPEHGWDPPPAPARRHPRQSEPAAPTGTQILVVDDDAHVSMLVTRHLALDGFASEHAKDAAAAVDAIRHRRPDLVLLDGIMPGRDGLDLLRQLRGEGDDLPVIMLSARGDEGDRITGLRLGADDYIAKPFSPGELVARVKAVLRRGDGSSRRVALEFDGLTVDMATRKVTVRGEVVPTTTKEFALLAFLASSPDHVFTREQLLDKVWGSSSDWQHASTVTEHVRRIRRLIEEDATRPRWIRTVRGVGYIFEPRAPAGFKV